MQQRCKRCRLRPEHRSRHSTLPLVLVASSNPSQFRSGVARPIVSSRGPKSVHDGKDKVCRPASGTGSPHSGQGVPPAALHSWLVPFKSISAFLTSVFFLGCCFVATQLARQSHQERTQVVYSNREARKRPARKLYTYKYIRIYTLPQWTLNLKAYARTCRRTKEK